MSWRWRPSLLPAALAVGLLLACLLQFAAADSASEMICDLPLTFQERGVLLRGLTRTDLEKAWAPPYFVIGAYPLASSLILAEVVKTLLQRLVGFDSVQIKLTGFKTAPADLRSGKIHILLDFRPRAAFPTVPSGVMAFYSDPEVDPIGALGGTSRPGLYISGTLRARIQQAMVRAVVASGTASASKIAFYQSLDISSPSMTWLKLMDYLLSDANIDRSLIPAAISGYALVPVDDTTLLAASAGSSSSSSSSGSSTSKKNIDSTLTELWGDSLSRLCAAPSSLKYALGQIDPPSNLPSLVLRPFYKLGLVIGCKLVPGGEETLLTAIEDHIAMQGGRKDMMVILPSETSLIHAIDRVFPHFATTADPSLADGHHEVPMDWMRFPLPYLSTAAAKTAGVADPSATATPTPAPAYYTDNTGDDPLTPNIYTIEDTDWPIDVLGKVAWGGLKKFFPPSVREGLDDFRWTNRAEGAALDAYTLLLSNLETSYVSAATGLLNAVNSDMADAGKDYITRISQNMDYYDNATGAFRPELAVQDHDALLRKLDSGVTMATLESELGPVITTKMTAIFDSTSSDGDFKVDTTAAVDSGGGAAARRLQAERDKSPLANKREGLKPATPRLAAFARMDEGLLFDGQGRLFTGFGNEEEEGYGLEVPPPPMASSRPWQDVVVEPLAGEELRWWRRRLGLNETNGLPPVFGWR
jgi:hypothetical protein